MSDKTRKAKKQPPTNQATVEAREVEEPLPVEFTIKGVGDNKSSGTRGWYEAVMEARRTRWAAGRYTLEEAALKICEPHNGNAAGMLKALARDAENNVFPRYWADKPERIKVKTVRVDIDEVYWYDLNIWLEANEPEIFKGFQFPAPHGAAVVPTGSATSPASKPTAERIIHKLRRDLLDPAIDEAIKQAGSDDVAAVWPHLRENAKGKTLPFTGPTNATGLYYIDVKERRALFTISALAARLKRRREQK